MVTFALTLSDLIERGGSYAGLAAFFGLAVLTILYFAQAREIRRLRDWAGRSPERAQELEERVVAQAEAAKRVQAKPIRRPGQPATVAAKAVAATPAATAVVPAVTDAPEAPGAEEERTDAEEGSATEHDIVPAAGASSASPGETGSAGQATAEDDAIASDEEPEDEQVEASEAEEETDVVPAGVVASAAPTPTDAPTTVTPAPGNGAPPSTPALPPRATQGPTVRRPGQPALPQRPAPAPVRRVGGTAPPPRRPGPPPPIQRDREPGRRRTGIIAAGALAGVTLVVVGLIALLGGGGDDPTQATQADPTPTAAASVAPAGGNQGSGNEPDSTPEPGGPERASTAVAVLNGTATSGLAATLNDQLVQAGYTESQAPTNWLDSTRSASIVFYASSEYRTQAIAIAEQLQIADRQPIIEEASQLAPGANVVVLIGADQTP